MKSERTDGNTFYYYIVSFFLTIGKVACLLEREILAGCLPPLPTNGTMEFFNQKTISHGSSFYLSAFPTEPTR